MDFVYSSNNPIEIKRRKPVPCSTGQVFVYITPIGEIAKQFRDETPCVSLPDAEVLEYPVNNFFRRILAGDLGEGFQGLAQVDFAQVQRKAGIGVDGSCGTQTWAALQKQLFGSSTGGTGTMMLITLGTLVAVGFAILLITQKKMTAYRD